MFRLPSKFILQMSQKTIVIYLHIVEMALDAIDENLVRTLEQQAVTSSIMTSFVRNPWSGLTIDAISVEPAETWRGPVDDAILKDLGDCLFSSVRELSRLTSIPRSTVPRHLT
jgi:hypothetical protein